MQKTSILYFVFCFALLVAGCSLTGKTAAKETGKKGVTSDVKTSAAEIGATSNSLDTKSAEVDTKLKERDGAILADANAAQTANTGNPDGVPKEKVDSHLTVLKSRLGDAAVDPVAAADAANRDKLFEMGRAVEARAATDLAVKEGLQKSSELALAQLELKTVRETLGAQVSTLSSRVVELEAQIARNTAINQAAIDTALDKAQKEARKEQSRWLTIGAIVLIIAGLLLAYAKFNAGEPFKAAIVGGFFGGGAFFCASLAYLLTEPWFQRFLKISIISGSILGVLAGIAFIVVEIRSAKEKKLLAEKAKTLDKDATEADAALLKVYDTLEQNLPKEQLIMLTEKFRGALDSNEKAYINELKALRQRTSAAPSPIL